MKYKIPLLNCTLAVAFVIICIQLRESDSTDEVDGPQRLPPLGRSMRREFFMEDNFIFLNHGSYGTYPKAVRTELRKFQEIAELNPDRWFRQDLIKEHTKVREMLAKIVNADAEDLVLVPNTTGGMNAIFRSLVFAAGERILHFNTIYASMGAIIQYLVDKSNGSLSKLVFNVTYPMSNEDLLQKFETFLTKNEDPKHPIRIALIDHISSVPGVVNPVDKIIPMLKQRNITVLIDGAHAIGQVPIDLKVLQPDFYITNCHKWLYAARGTAILYVAKKNQPFIHPGFINAEYSQPAKLQDEFFWTGTMDFSSYMTVPAALQFRKEVGGEVAIMEYNHNLAYLGGQLLASAFNTEVLQEKNQIGSMVDVRLPVDNPDDPKLTPRWWVDEQLNMKYNQTFSPAYRHNGHWWVRVSAQIYNDLSDFDICAQHFLAICNDLNNGSSSTNGSNNPTPDIVSTLFKDVVLVVLGVHSGDGGRKRLPPLGRAMRGEFYIDDDFVQLNHGAYGTYPKVVGKHSEQLKKGKSERNPDLWLRREVKTELAKVREMLAKLVNADSTDVVMVPNTTSGINAVFRSLVFAAGERILHLSTIYNSMGSIIQYLVDYSNGSLSKIVFNVTYPISNEAFLQSFETFLDEQADPEHPIRIALVDHITSVPAVIMPIERIIPMLKARNISVLIDGAHAIGQVPINITALQPDYYVTNCHKWLYAARGCALLYVDKKHQGEVHPANINSGYRQPANFQNEFFWTGLFT
ncbi:hypothetical protein Ocin01_09069 [Orchesella cincta]|uniref:Aminotransferase class V domain-containing protein n=1 Tax=Orchesella cincta TaxID=48709 RepID=A0A1D2MX15_ORCCI|nr:hypothetical protein Ocin01_09069 [Orchesella cincta]